MNDSFLKDEVCFYCRFYTHLDPDTDFCARQDVEVYFDAPACGFFRYYMDHDDDDEV